MNWKTTIAVLASAFILGNEAAAQQTGSTEGGQSEAPNVEVDQYRDWVLRCENNEQVSRRTCVLFQRLVVQDTGRVIMQATVARPQDPADPAVVVLMLPLGIYLPFGAELSIDGGQPIPLTIRTCMQRGCSAVLMLEPELLRAFQDGLKARVRVKQNNNENLDLELSLKGFRAGFAALTAGTPSG